MINLTSNVTACSIAKRLLNKWLLPRLKKKEVLYREKLMAEEKGTCCFLKLCTKLKDILLPQMGCKMPEKAAFHPRLSRAQQPDDERLYSYRLTTNRFFSSYSALKLPFEDKGQNILNATMPYDPNYHVKTFKISWTRHDHLNKNQRQLACLKAFIMAVQLWYQLGSKMGSGNKSALTYLKCKYATALEVFWEQFSSFFFFCYYFSSS